MKSEEAKKFCLDLLRASNADEVVDLLKQKDFWDVIFIFSIPR